MYSMKSENWRNKKISLILPTCNERESIREVINRFNELGIFHEIIVVNNNAYPGTSEEVTKTDVLEVLEEHQGYILQSSEIILAVKGDLVGVSVQVNTFVEKYIVFRKPPSIMIHFFRGSGSQGYRNESLSKS